jgi:hypothetical protein
VPEHPVPAAAPPGRAGPGQAQGGNTPFQLGALDSLMAESPLATMQALSWICCMLFTEQLFA